MRAYIKTLSLVGVTAALSFLLGLGIAHADGVTSPSAQDPAVVLKGDTGDTGAAGAKGDKGDPGSSPTFGTCALSGLAVPTCAATVPATCAAPVCSYVSSTLPHAVSCAVVGTTLTAVSATALDSGTVAFVCP